MTFKLGRNPYVNPQVNLHQSYVLPHQSYVLPKIFLKSYF